MPAESIGGSVFGIAQTVVNPPRAAASVPVAIVSLCSKPGLAQMRVYVDEARTDDEARGVDGLAAVFTCIWPDRGDHAVRQEHVGDTVDAS